MLEATELLSRLVGRPNPTTTEVRRLRKLYEAALDRVFDGNPSISFSIDSKPGEEDFNAGWVWPYYLDLTNPIQFSGTRRGRKAVIEAVATHDLVAVRFEQVGEKPKLLVRKNLPYIRPSVYFTKDQEWDKRKAWFEFGIDLANFAAKHKPQPTTA